MSAASRADALRAHAEQIRQTPEYLAAAMVLDLTEDVAGQMKRIGVSRAELARRLDVSNAAVTRMLSGHSNPRLSTIAKLAAAIGLKPELRLRAGRSAPEIFRRTARAAFSMLPVEAEEADSDEAAQALPIAA